MMFKFAFAGVLVALSTVAAAAEKPAVQVMVLGAYHFGNPGLDLNNAKVDSVLTPQKQSELARVAAALAQFKPTHVMVEMQSDAADLAVAEYSRFDDAMLATKANEIVQIAYRTARAAGLKTVNGIDEQPKDDEPEYYPYDKLQETAAKFGQSARLKDANTGTIAWLKGFERDQKIFSVGQMLTNVNDPASIFGRADADYALLGIGDTDTQTGADFVAAYYLRNAKIFAKLTKLTKPGDRVLVVYGAGHSFWLRHFASQVPGYQNVDVLPYLANAK